MKQSILWLSVFLLFACQTEKEDACKQDFLVIPIGGKLEALLSLPQDTVLEYYDLSNDFLFDFPDLSGYKIRYLNISHNYLDTLNPAFLPQELEKLNLSYNTFTYFCCDSLNQVKEVDFSYNNLKYFHLTYFVDHLDLSYNDLGWIRLFWTYDRFTKLCKYRTKKEQEKMSFLNISHNPNLKHTVGFEPNKINTIIRNNTANNKELVEIEKYMLWEINHLKGVW